MRLTKFLFLSDAMSRSQAGYFIIRGRVMVDGEVVTDPNFIVNEDSKVRFDNNPVSIKDYHYIMLHKPVGYVCATKSQDFPSVLELLADTDQAHYYHFVNQLAPSLSGMVLLSDDVNWKTRMVSKLKRVKKRYRVTTKKTIDDEQIQKLQNMYYHNEQNHRAKLEIERIDVNTLLIGAIDGTQQKIIDILTDNNYVVATMSLVALGALSLGDLQEGASVERSADEMKV